MSSIGALLKFIGTTKTVGGGLQEDDDWQDNVNFIKSMVGDDVEISKDLPLFHSGCGFEIGEKGLLKDMDTAMKAAMMISEKAVTDKQKANDGFISWKHLQQIFDSGIEFDPQPDADTQKADYMSDGDVSVFKFDGSASQEDIAKVDTKMQNFVGDPAIWKNLQINRSTIAKLFGQNGVRVKDFASFFYGESKKAHVAIDCGAVRFPKAQDPWFRLYRFRVIVTNFSQRLLMIQNDSKSLVMSLTTRKYGMNQIFMDKFKGPIKEKVDEKFDDYLEKLRL